MSTWKELCDGAEWAKRTHNKIMDDAPPGIWLKSEDFDKLRAVVEAADKYAGVHAGPEGYANWQVLCKALDELGVGD